jgi:tRNA(Ile)-lysidine synthase
MSTGRKSDSVGHLKEYCNVVTQLIRPARSRLLKQVLRTVREQRLFVPDQHLLVAVSGGADSTALLALLLDLAPAWRLTLTAVHVNYRLRGAESDADETFVSTFCKNRKIPLVVLRPTLAKQRRQSSLQAMARDARYDAMKTLAREINADRIVVGHTANDQAETMLMWMLRGAGLTGLAGMPFIRESIIVRPLLSSTREEILEFLNCEGLTYREDSSNGTGRYLRNRIRKDLLPVVTKIAPAAIGLLQRQADLLREDERFLEKVTGQQFSSLITQHAGGEYQFDRCAFSSLPTALQRRLLRMMLRMHQTESCAASIHVIETARRFCLKGKQGLCLSLRNVVIRREGETLIISRRKQARPAAMVASVLETEVPIGEPSMVYWARTNTQFHVQVLSRQEAEPLLGIRSKYQALFDADLVSAPLVLRSWRSGDRFYPSGMKGRRKKLQDLFTDMKIPRSEREAIPVLVAPEGILWVATMRQDERFLLRAGSKRCLVVTMIDGLVGEGER